MIGIIALLIGFWAIATAMIFMIFGEDVIENQRCGRSVVAGFQMVAIVGAFPLIIGALRLTIL